MMGFNLVDEPWIPVTTTAGKTRDVSLPELFADATTIRRISAPLPTVSFALLRLALAITHHAIGFHSRTSIERALDEGVDTSRILQYLQKYHDRFDLFDDKRPFYQVATLRTAKGTASGLEMLISDVPNGHPFMTTRMGRGLERISPAEAAQWLVHAQAYDPSGIRSAAVGDPLAKGGKGYPTGPGWVGRIGGVALHGRHFSETLVFNLAPLPEHPDDVPVWALAQPQTEQRQLEAEPAGPLSVLTWQARRIRLVGDPSGVTGIVLAQGDQLKEQNRQTLEAMTAWRYSKPQTTKLKVKTYMPNKHDPARSVWRGMPVLLGVGSRQVDGSPAHLPPATLTQLQESSLDDTYDLRAAIEVVGMDYGPQEATVEEVVHDILDFRLSLLTDDGAEVREMLDGCIAQADTCVWALGRMGANIAAASGDFDGLDGARDRAMLQAWSALDAPAREWLSQLSASSSVTDEHRRWQQIVADTLIEEAQRLANAASPAAIVGRQTKHGYMTAGLAEAYFRATLRKELQLVFKSTDHQEADDE